MYASIQEEKTRESKIINSIYRIGCINLNLSGKRIDIPIQNQPLNSIV